MPKAIETWHQLIDSNDSSGLDDLLADDVVSLSPSVVEDQIRARRGRATDAHCARRQRRRSTLYRRAQRRSRMPGRGATIPPLKSDPSSSQSTAFASSVNALTEICSVDGNSFCKFDIIDRIIIRVDESQFERVVPTVLLGISNHFKGVNR